MKLLSRKNIALKFKDIERKETFMPDLSGQSGRRYIIQRTPPKVGAVVCAQGHCGPVTEA
jgi:hypothetical protein